MTKYANYADPSVKTRHANTAIVKIGGNVIGELAGLQTRESGGTDGSYVVGDAKPTEHLHNRWTCTGSVSRFVWKESAFEHYNIGRKGLLDLPPVDIEAQDDIDGVVLFTLLKCTFSDRSMNIQANQRLMSDMSFLALDILETDTAANGTQQATSTATNGSGDTPNLTDQPALAGTTTGGVTAI